MSARTTVYLCAEALGAGATRCLAPGADTNDRDFTCANGHTTPAERLVPARWLGDALVVRISDIPPREPSS